MSIETRQKLADDPRLVLSNNSQYTDILDTSKTNTWLIEFLVRLLDECPRPILITALNSDHSAGTYHNPPGQAVDCWHADWATVGDDKIVEVMSAAGKIGRSGQPTLLEVGLSGDAALYQTYVTWPDSADVFVEDYGHDNEHIHLAVGCPT
jgi:hypothetical protein